MKRKDDKLIKLSMNGSKYLDIAIEAEELGRQDDALDFFFAAYEKSDKQTDVYVMQRYSEFLEDCGYSEASFDLLLKSYIASRFDKSTLLDIVYFLHDLGIIKALPAFFNRFWFGEGRNLDDSILPDGMTQEVFCGALYDAMLSVENQGIREASDYTDNEVVEKLINCLDDKLDEKVIAEKIENLCFSIPSWQKEKLSEAIYFILMQAVGLYSNLGMDKKAFCVCDAAEKVFPDAVEDIRLKSLLVMANRKDLYSDKIEEIKNSFANAANISDSFLFFLETDGDYDRILVLTEKKVKEPFPERHYLYYYGIALLRLGQYEQAKKSFVRLSKIDPCYIFGRCLLHYADLLLSDKLPKKFYPDSKLPLSETYSEYILNMKDEELLHLLNTNPELLSVVVDYSFKVFKKPTVFLQAIYNINKEKTLQCIKELLFSAYYSVEVKRSVLAFSLQRYSGTEFNIRVNYNLNTIQTSPVLPHSKKLCADLVSDLCFKAPLFVSDTYSNIAVAADELYERLRAHGMSYSLYRRKEELFVLVLVNSGFDKKAVLNYYDVDQNKLSLLTEKLYTDSEVEQHE